MGLEKQSILCIVELPGGPSCQNLHWQPCHEGIGPRRVIWGGVVCPGGFSWPVELALLLWAYLRQGHWLGLPVGFSYTGAVVAWHLDSSSVPFPR
jgi:hypothetical protein